MKIQIVILPQWVLTRYAENFTPDVLSSLLKELNASKPVVGENHVNLKLGVVERAYYQSGVGIVVEANIESERASTQLRNQLNNFFNTPQRNIYASFAGSFDTTPKSRSASTIFDVLSAHPNVRINRIQPVEVSLLSSTYNPAIAGSMLRHNARGDVESILTADFDLNNGGVKEKNMSNEESKKETPPAADAGVSDKDFEMYVAEIQDSAYEQGLLVGQTRSSLETNIAKHELILEDDEKKIFKEYLETKKRPTADMLKLVGELQSTIKHNERKMSKKVEGSKTEEGKGTEEKKTEKMEEKSKEKAMPPRPDPPKNDIDKDKKKVPDSFKSKIKMLAETLKKNSS